MAYFSTGDEILRPGEPPRPGAIYDSNRATLTSLLARLGAQVIDLGAVPDDPAQIAAAFARAAAQADAVITSGGVSTGDADHTRAMLQQLGDVVSWRLAMRPGRPMVVGRIDPRAGTPGHESTPIWPHDIRYEVQVASPASDEELATLFEAVERNCPILNLLRNPQQIQGTLVRQHLSQELAAA